MIAFVIMPGLSFCQSAEFYPGLLPQIEKPVEINDRLEYTGRIENLFLWDERNDQRVFLHARADLRHIFIYEFAKNWEVTGGYQTRYTEHQWFHRFLEQVEYKTDSKLNISHRFRFDQTIGETDATKYRLRYRLASEIPVEQLENDISGNFISASVETFGIQKDRQEDIENRIIVKYVSELANKDGVEIGLDYRTDQYLTDGFRHRLFCLMRYSF